MTSQDGSQALRAVPDPSGIEWDTGRVAADLCGELERGGRVLLCARDSQQGEKEGLQAAVNGIYRAADKLALHGITVRHLLPEPKALISAAKAGSETTVHTQFDGRSFRLSNYVHTDSEDQGLVVLVQYGSGRMLDEEQNQPAIDEVAENVDRFEPALLFASEVRGWGRSDWAFAPVVNRLRHLSARAGQPFLGLIGGRINACDDRALADLFFEAQAAGNEAQVTYERTRDGMMNATSQDGIDHGPCVGMVRVGSSGALPVPLAKARVRTATRAATIAYLDTPGCRPDPTRVVTRLRAIRAPDADEADVGTSSLPVAPVAGAGPDQLALVRFFYEHWLTPGWDDLTMARYLCRNGFVSEGLLRSPRRDPSQPYTLRENGPVKDLSRDARTVVNSIWRSREFHRTGLLAVRVDGTRSKQLTVTTPDGAPIATEDEIARIELALADRPRPRHGSKYATFAGLPVSVAGEKCRTISHWRGDSLVYHFEHVGPLESTASTVDRRRSPAPAMSHDFLASCIFEAIINHSQAMEVATSSMADDVRLVEELRAATRCVREATAGVEEYQGHLKVSGLSPTTLRAIDVELAAWSQTLTEARERERRAAHALASVEAAQNRGVPVSAVLRLVCALADPHDQEFRDVWASSIENFVATISTTVLNGRKRHLRQLHITFDLIITGADGRQWRLPVAGTRSSGKPIPPRIVLALEKMRDGVPFERTMGADSVNWMPWMRAALGHRDPDAPCWILKVKDPRLVRIAMATLYPPLLDPVESPPESTPEDFPVLVGPPLSPRAAARAAKALGEPPSLVSRLMSLYSTPGYSKIPWLWPAFPTARAILDEIHGPGLTSQQLPDDLKTADGTPIVEVFRGRITTTPCPWCRSRRRDVLRLREVAGLVCTKCRRDDLGHHWPSNVYDEYRC